MQKNILYVLFGILLIGLFISNSAYGISSRCEDNMLIREINITKNVSGTITEYIFTDFETCPYGCEDNLTKYGSDCLDPPYMTTIYVIIGILLIFGIMVAVGGRR